MQIKEGARGQLVVSGRSEEWKHLEDGLEEVYRVLKREVLPVARDPERAGEGVVVGLREALAITAIQGDRELIHAMNRIILDTGRPPAGGL